MKQHTQFRLHVSLGSYATAAAALGVVATPASAEIVPADPLGGFPIVINSSHINGFDFDINGDGEDDARIRYTSTYGGGFEIMPISRGDASNVFIGYEIDPGQQVSREYVYVAPRFDPSEWISQQNELIDFACYCGMMLDTPAGVGYHPFVDRPGFIGLRMQPISGGMGTPPAQLGYLEIVVSNDSQVLHVLSAGFDDSAAFAIQLPASLTPPPTP